MKKKDKIIFHLRYLPLVACTKDQLLGFNNDSLFVNSLLRLILCGDIVYVCKFKKNRVFPRNCGDKTQKLGD